MGERRWRTRSDSFSSQVIAHSEAASDIAARIQKCRGCQWSRLAEDVVERQGLAGGMSSIGFAVKGCEFAGSGIGLHLAIPIVISPAAEFSGDLGAVFERELADGDFDFLYRAHTEKMPCKGVSGNFDFFKTVAILAERWGQKNGFSHIFALYFSANIPCFSGAASLF
jgi:hypothetical protein